ncbi:MAG: hypothetical protein HYV96_06135 [Opitutae bacterium]|nr:hypothetical protein [Opitutae bacterium]
MTRPAQLRRLHFLNALFAPLTGHDLYLAQQIDAAIVTSLDAQLARAESDSSAEIAPNDPAFVKAAAQLFARLCRERESHGFFHWDAAAEANAATPLFARANLMQGLKQLAACREATVLITNLRPALCPDAKRGAAKRQREYDETLDLLRKLTAARTRRGANVNLLFL